LSTPSLLIRFVSTFVRTFVRSCCKSIFKTSSSSAFKMDILEKFRQTVFYDHERGISGCPVAGGHQTMFYFLVTNARECPTSKVYVYWIVVTNARECQMKKLHVFWIVKRSTMTEHKCEIPCKSQTKRKVTKY
jgi:hypothetical protein